jgi:hypothetical protein
MADNAKLTLKMLNAEGNFLKEKVDILLRNQTLSGLKKASITASKSVAVTGLSGPPHNLYRMEIDPPSYLPVNRFITVGTSGDPLEIIFPIDPKKVTKAIFPKYGSLSEGARALLGRSDQVLSSLGKTGEELYGALDDLRCAGMLNILTKTGATPLNDEQTVLDLLKEGELRELRGDRFFAVVPKELREEVKNSVAAGLFEKVSGALHHLPGQFTGFSDAGSFKTHDRYWNLQLTFFMKGNECVADIDIDNASGLGHVFQVLNNMLPGNSTHPYTIRDILLVHQKLDPGYRFKL